MELSDLLATSDMVCVCVSIDAGEDWFNKEKISQLKDGTIINVLTDRVLCEDDLLVELQSGRLKAYLDWTPKDPEFKKLPLDVFYCSTESTAFNSRDANKKVSDWSTESMLNLLKNGKDKYLINPDYKK